MFLEWVFILQTPVSIIIMFTIVMIKTKTIPGWVCLDLRSRGRATIEGVRSLKARAHPPRKIRPLQFLVGKIQQETACILDRDFPPLS